VGGSHPKPPLAFGRLGDSPYPLINLKYCDMTDLQLKIMKRDEANKVLSEEDKYRWVALKNSTANLYFIKNGNIKAIDPAGWWY
jgi:hypothetical protein